MQKQKEILVDMGGMLVQMDQMTDRTVPRPDRHSKLNTAILYGRDELNRERKVPQELIDVQVEWHNLSKKIGDLGPCVIGAGIQFFYKERWYVMLPAGPYQGSHSWERTKDSVMAKLEAMGATDIFYHWGMMD